MTAAPYSFWMYIGTSVWAASRASAESTKPAGWVVVVRATVVDVEPPPIVVGRRRRGRAAAGATVVGSPVATAAVPRAWSAGREATPIASAPNPVSRHDAATSGTSRRRGRDPSPRRYPQGRCARPHRAAMMEDMCGRFVSASSPETIAEYFGATFAGETLGENFNVAPTNDVYGVVADEDGDRRVEAFHWGLVPVWAKEAKIGAKMINARAETLAEKPAYKGVFKKHRCIIPMDGFYEWQAGTEGGPVTAKGKPAKQPMFIHRVDGEPLAVAGLWSAWRDKAAGDEAPWLHSDDGRHHVGQRHDGARSTTACR